jgi:arylsulfatase A-like enzyme
MAVRVKRSRGGARVALLAGLAALGCGGAPRQPDLVLISLDTLRADHLGVYGYARDTSPHLDAWAAGGAVFERAFAPSGWTLPSHATMVTGLPPRAHGALHAASRIGGDVVTLAEALREAGYVTRGVVSAPFVGERFGFAQGFDRYEEFRPTEVAEHHAAALQVLGLTSERPVFFFLHYMVTHSPYSPPDAFDLFTEGAAFPELSRKLNDRKKELQAGTRDVSDAEARYLAARYDGEIRFLDSMLGELFRAIEERDASRTVVLLTSDHGEEFLDHGSLVHNDSLFDELIRVPFILRGPQVPAGTRVMTLCGLIDVMPTLLDLAGVEASEAHRGRSVLEWNAAARTEPRVLELLTGEPFVGRHLTHAGVRAADAKLVVDLRSGDRAFYDVARDPGERRNLYPHDPRVPELEAALRREAPRAGEPIDLDAADLEALRELGYVP